MLITPPRSHVQHDTPKQNHHQQKVFNIFFRDFRVGKNTTSACDCRRRVGKKEENCAFQIGRRSKTVIFSSGGEESRFAYEKLPPLKSFWEGCRVPAFCVRNVRPNADRQALPGGQYLLGVSIAGGQGF